MFSAPIGLCSIPFMYIAEMFPLEVIQSNTNKHFKNFYEIILDQEFDGRTNNLPIKHRDVHSGENVCQSAMYHTRFWSLWTV